MTLRPTGTKPPVEMIGPVESGVPVPPISRDRAATVFRSSSALRKRVAELKPGQSFVTAHSRQAVRYHAKRLGIKLIQRRLTGGCYKFWRIFE